ncbi:phospholipase [Ramlibacter sp. AN1015]|uniref:patatin-like phospholipase family protein n=1 Tax=Ramlibacter sp. AN1015 TaxID=3133428 RepID=UPI0030C4F370
MAGPRALRIYAGPAARQHIAREGLRAEDIGAIPAAAGGPKGLVLGPLDRFIFGDWLPRSSQPVHLVGASIGAWRMAAACLPDASAAFARLSHDYIRQQYEVAPGRRMPTPEHVSERFGQGLRSFYGEQVASVLGHPRWRLHVVTARGRHLLGREHRLATPLGYLGAFLSNAVHRKALGAWLERVVFSTGGASLPFDTQDFRTRRVALTQDNFFQVVQASCSIPFALRAVHDIPGAPPGAYWDGGITDYHLHLCWHPPSRGGGLVLYPHFQRAVVPGWLDKGLRWRHAATSFLDHMVVLAPDPAWVARLPNGKLPDRTDFSRYALDFDARVAAWSAAVAASEQLAEEFSAWIERPDVRHVEAL